MVATGIERTPTEIERREMSMVGEKSPESIFRGVVALKQQEFAKKRLPFDLQCALIDYKQEMSDIKRESERVHGYVLESDLKNVKIDLDKYGEASRFTIESDDEEIEMQNINGVRTPAKTGHTIRYRCKRGHGISVFMSTETYDEKFGKKKKED